MIPTLQFTEDLVREKFAGQYDRSDVPMADHMMRVASHLSDQDEATQHVAWMHDLVEDTDVDFGYLQALGYSEEILEALDLVTHDKKTHTYAEYIDRICKSGNRIAIYVKLADQKDNLDPKRWVRLNRFVQNALRKRYNGVQEKLMAAAMELQNA